MEDLEYVQAYLNDLLCISRSSLEDHLKKLEEVLRHLPDADLKVNAEKSTFCALEIEYLGTYRPEMALNPRVIRCRQYLQFNHPQMSKNSCIS